jgi:hypothetical protein
MFDEKILHPDLDTIIKTMETLGKQELLKLRSVIIKCEKRLIQEEAKKRVTTFHDITSGSILLATKLNSTNQHCVVLAPSKYKSDGFVVWYLNEDIDEITASAIVAHEINEPYVPLQLRPEEGKKYRVPLSKAKEDLRKKYANELKGE